MSEARVHPTAMVSPQAELGSEVEVGAGATVGPNVTVGDGAVIGPWAILERNVRLGERCRVGPFSVIGGDPQDLKFQGEETWVEIGDESVLREYVTVNRGTAQSGSTTVGRGCLVMTSVHVAHDCHLGNGVILSNGVGLAGHVIIGDRAIVGGMTGVHQFVRIGTYAFVGGMAKVTKDVPPYTKADGNPSRLYGLNTIGLQRAGFPRETIEELKRAYRLFFRSDLNISQAQERARTELAQLPEVVEFVRFIAGSERGVLV
jgi:UDP-N-acetylglucosamine acyltransferase